MQNSQVKLQLGQSSISGIQRSNLMSPTKQMKQIINNQSNQEKEIDSELTVLGQSIASQNTVKPTNVEAQRVLKILDELSTNIKILNVIESSFIENFSEDPKKTQFATVNFANISEEALSLLRKQSKIEEKFKELEFETEQSFQLEEQKLKNEENDTESEQQDEMKEEELKQEAEKKIERQLKRSIKKDKNQKQLEENFKNLLRVLRKNDNDMQHLRSATQKINQKIFKTLNLIEFLKNIMYKKLSTAAEEKESHERQLKELSDKIQKLERNKKNTEGNLNTTRYKKKKFGEEKKAEIENYRKAIEDVKIQKQKKLDELEEKKKKELKEQADQHKIKVDKLTERIKALKTELETQKTEHNKIEDNLNKNKKTQEKSYRDSVANYDQTMKDYTQEKENEELKRNEIQTELDGLRDYLQRVDAELKREQALEEEYAQRQRDKDLQEKKIESAIFFIKNAFKHFTKKKAKKGRKKKS